MPTANQWISRTSVAIAVALVISSSALPAESTDDSEAARVALGAVSKQLGVDPATLKVATVATAYYPNLDQSAQSFKIVDAEGLLHAIAVDAKLNPADPQSLAASERAERLRKFGALDPALARRIERSGEEAIPVNLWVRDTTKRRWDRPTAQGEPLAPAAVDEVYASVTATRAAAVGAIVAPVLKRVRAYDGKASANDLAPVIGATLTAGALRELARDP